MLTVMTAVGNSLVSRIVPWFTSTRALLERIRLPKTTRTLWIGTDEGRFR